MCIQMNVSMPLYPQLRMYGCEGVSMMCVQWEGNLGMGLVVDSCNDRRCPYSPHNHVTVDPLRVWSGGSAGERVDPHAGPGETHSEFRPPGHASLLLCHHAGPRCSLQGGPEIPRVAPRACSLLGGGGVSFLCSTPGSGCCWLRWDERHLAHSCVTTTLSHAREKTEKRF